MAGVNYYPRCGIQPPWMEKNKVSHDWRDFNFEHGVRALIGLLSQFVLGLFNLSKFE